MWCKNLSEPQSADPSVSKFDCKCFRARALLVTSGAHIFKMLGSKRLAMLKNDSACISTKGYVVLQFIRALKHQPTCHSVSQSLTLISADIKMLGMKRLAMLTNYFESACISTIGYVVLCFIRASERQPTCLKL